MTIAYFELLGAVIDKEITFISEQLGKSTDEVYELILDEAERNQS